MGLTRRGGAGEACEGLLPTLFRTRQHGGPLPRRVDAFPLPCDECDAHLHLAASSAPSRSRLPLCDSHLT